jgi:nicotinamidase-related amidase
MVTTSVAFWDVNTQQDFILPEGKLHVPGAEKIRDRLRKLYAFARRARIPAVATADAHVPGHAKLQDWPPHCVVGTEGQEKLPETRVPRAAVLSLDVREAPVLRPGGQIVLEKSHMDAFTHPCARAIVEKSGIGHWIVFGVMTDYSVRLSVLGLLKLGRKVTVVTDAVAGWAADTSRQAVIEMQAAGAEFRTAGAVLRSLAPSRRKTKEKKRP